MHLVFRVKKMPSAEKENLSRSHSVRCYQFCSDNPGPWFEICHFLRVRVFLFRWQVDEPLLVWTTSSNFDSFSRFVSLDIYFGLWLTEQVRSSGFLDGFLIGSKVFIILQYHIYIYILIELEKNSNIVHQQPRSGERREQCPANLVHSFKNGQTSSFGEQKIYQYYCILVLVYLCILLNTPRATLIDRCMAVYMYTL